MPKRTPLNITAFEADQRRTVENIYDIISELTTEDLVERKVISLITGGSGGSSVASLGDLNDVLFSSKTAGDILRYNGTNWVNSTTFTVPMTFNDYLDLDQITPPSGPGTTTLRLYNADEGGFSVLRYVNSSAIDFQISRDTVHIARNNSGATITAGSAVYITGSNGNYPTIDLADASDPSTMPFFGLAVQDIADNSFGEILTQGDLTGLDTSSFIDGDLLYVSDSTPGTLTTTVPTGNSVPQVAGTVIKSAGGGGGIIEVETGTLFDFTWPNNNASWNNLDVGNQLTVGTATVTDTDLGNYDTAYVNHIDDVTFDSGTDVITFSRPADPGGDITINLSEYETPTWTDITGKPFETVNTGTGQFAIVSNQLNLPQDLGTTSSPTFAGATFTSTVDIDGALNLDAANTHITLTDTDWADQNDYVAIDVNGDEFAVFYHDDSAGTFEDLITASRTSGDVTIPTGDLIASNGFTVSTGPSSFSGNVSLLSGDLSLASGGISIIGATDSELTLRHPSATGNANIWWLNSSGNNNWFLGQTDENNEMKLLRYNSSGVFQDTPWSVSSSGMVYMDNGYRVGGDVQADNFSAGSTGWQISYAGSLEAEDATLRNGLTINAGGASITGNTSILSGDLSVNGSVDLTDELNMSRSQIAPIDFELPDDLGGFSIPVRIAGYSDQSAHGQTAFQIRIADGSDVFWFDADGLEIQDGGLEVLTTIDSGDRMRVTNASDYAELQYYGIQFNRNPSYLRPVADGTDNLNIGSGSLRWNNINLEFAGTFNTNGATVFTAGEEQELGTGGSPTFNALTVSNLATLQGNVSVSGDLNVDGVFRSQVPVTDTRLMYSMQNNWFNISEVGGRANLVWWAEPNATNDGFDHSHPTLFPFWMRSRGQDIYFETTDAHAGGGSATGTRQTLMRMELDNQIVYTDVETQIGDSFQFDTGGRLNWGAGFDEGRLTWGSGYAQIQSLGSNELRLKSGSNEVVVDGTNFFTIRDSGDLVFRFRDSLDANQARLVWDDSESEYYMINDVVSSKFVMDGSGTFWFNDAVGISDNGIAQFSPSQALDIRSTSTGNIGVRVENQDASGGAQLHLRVGSADWWIRNDGTDLVLDDDGTIRVTFGVVSTTIEDNLAVSGTSSFTGDVTMANALVVEGDDGLHFTDTATTKGISMDGSGGDGFGFRRITWNDGAGNWNFRSHNYYDGANEVYIGPNGATHLRHLTDSQDGQFHWRVAPVGSDGAAISWNHNFIFSADGTFTYDGNNIIHAGNISTYADDYQSWTISDGSGSASVTSGTTASIEGGTLITTSLVGTTLTINSNADNYSSWTVEDDSTNTAAIGSGDTLKISGGTDLSTSLVGSVLTVNFTATPMTDWTAAADTGTSAVIGDGETVTWAGGTDIDTSISGNTITVDFVGSSFDATADETITGFWAFDHNLSSNKMRIASGGEDPWYMEFHDGTNSVARLRYDSTNNNFEIDSDRGGFIVYTGTGGSSTNYFEITSAGVLFSEAIRANTTGSAASVYINPITGEMQRSTSSARYKSDITPLSEKYDPEILMQFNPVWFTDRYGGQPHIGLVAEEVLELVPELVEVVNGQAEGVAYGHLTSLLAATIQQQQKRIEQLEAKLGG